MAAVAAVAGLLAVVVRQRRRRHGLRAMATQRGWTLTAMATGLPLAGRRIGRRLTARWSWHPFGHRNHGSAADLLTGEFDGREFAEFNYRYADPSIGGAVETIGVTTVRLPVALPRLQVSPDVAPAALVPGLRWLDVELGSEAFTHRYRVQAEDAGYAADVLDRRTVAAMLAVEPFTWRIDGRDLIAIGPPSGDPGEIMRRLQLVSAIAGNIPRSVIEDRGMPG